MNIEKSNLWQYSDPQTIVVVTTNGRLTSSGLVMGAGAALQAKKRYKTLPWYAANAISDVAAHPVMREVRLPNGKAKTELVWRYGFAFVEQFRIGLFQTKLHWRDKTAYLPLINESARKFAAFANTMPDTPFRLNYPGIGLGKLEREQVEPYLLVLPDNVTICYKD